MRTYRTWGGLKRIVVLAVVFSTLAVPIASAQETSRFQTTPPPAASRVNDSVLNGALIGAGVGIASGLLLCRTTEPWRNCRDDVGPMLKIGALGAGIGIGIDLLIRRRRKPDAEKADARLYAAPIVSRQAKGVRLSLCF